MNKSGSVTGSFKWVDDSMESESEGSSILQGNGSMVSNPPDRYGFIGGFQYSGEKDLDIPLSVLRKRESKWLHMLNNWERFMEKKFDKLRDRCRKGIPPSLRGRAWLHLCGAHKLIRQEPSLYERLHQKSAQPEVEDEIQRDLHRQFPMHEMFAEAGGKGQTELHNVLKAYSILNPQDGYCQGQAPVAATLLMHMPAEHAFWCLVSLCEKYLSGYFSPGLTQLEIDADLLFTMIKRTDAAVHRHLKSQGVTPLLFMTDWFMCAYVRTLPWETVLRVWDIFFCEGSKVLFRVGLALIRMTLGNSNQRRQCPNMYETIQSLRNIPNDCMTIPVLFHQMQKLNVSAEDLDREYRKLVRKRRAALKASASPSPRSR